MNSRERLLTALAGGTPDRVPITLFICDQGHFLSQMYPAYDPFDYVDCQKKVIDLQREFGCDVFVRLLFGVNEPLSIHCGGLDVSQQTEHWQVETKQHHSGESIVWESTIKTPGGILYQEYTRHEVLPGTYGYACTKKPIQTPEDLEIAIRYEPGMPADFPKRVRDHVRQIREYLGEDGICGTWSPHGPFNNASLLVDLDKLYCLFLTEPEFYERLITFAMERAIPYMQAMDAADADLHCVGGNVPGGFLGRKTYDKYILPYEKKYIAKVQENGKPAMYHNCGLIMGLVDSYKELGAKIVEPFSPPPLGDADLAEAKNRIDGAYAIVGGVDQVNVLQKGTRDEIRKATRDTILTGKPNGGFVLQSADFLEYDTPPENLRTYVETAMEFAQYR